MNDELVLVDGYGRIKESQVKKELGAYLEMAVCKFNNKDYSGLNWILFGSGVVRELSNTLKKEGEAKNGRTNNK